MGNLGNLGEYGSFTIRAASVGGVDKLIKIIETDAVRKQAPKIAAGFFIGGVVANEGGRRLYRLSRAKLAKRKADRAAAEAAREQLRSLVETDKPDTSLSA